MRANYEEYVNIFKALSDPNRLMIVDMLSCGELCACVLLERLHITQPTLSYHMKILCDCGLINGRKDGKWIYYSLSMETVRRFQEFFEAVMSAEENCICYETSMKEDCCK